jgi:hypothetical protein
MDECPARPIQASERLGDQVSYEGKVESIAMRKFHVFTLALFAVLALGAIVVMPAFASELLVEELSFAGELSGETEGLVTLLQYESATSAKILNELLCSGFFLLDLASNLFFVLDLATLPPIEIVEELEDLGPSITCEVDVDGGSLTDCEVGATNALLWPNELSLLTGNELSWHVEVLLVGTEWFADFPAQSGYHVECLTLLGVLASNTCKTAGGTTTADLTNNAGTSPASVLGQFLPLALMSERGECEVGGKEVAEVLGEGSTWALEGATRLATSLS